MQQVIERGIDMTTVEAVERLKSIKSLVDKYDDVVALREAIKALRQEPKTDVLDKIKGYVDHIRNTSMGKEKSLEFLDKFIEGLKAESEEQA
jgi:hypothetical protein